MKIRINDFNPKFMSVRIETNSYVRNKNYSKINFLKYADMKFMEYIPYELYKKNRDDKWVFVNPNDYIEPYTNRFLIEKVLRDSIIRNPFAPRIDPNEKVVDITKYIYAFLICFVGFAIFAVIFLIILVFFLK